jgi:CDK inhibitor PHO81
LAKLQKFVQINATGFRKILKKWDKRAKALTKEIYLSRQVEIQPVFNTDVLTSLQDKASQFLQDLEAKLGNMTANDQAETYLECPPHVVKYLISDQHGS